MENSRNIDLIKRQSEKLKRQNLERKIERSVKRKRTRERLGQEEVRRREMARKISNHVVEARISAHDKRIIVELGKSMSVNVVAEKMDLDLLTTAAIIEGVL